MKDTTMMGTNMKNLMRKYRLPETTTPENLACNWSTVLNFGNKVLLAGYYFFKGENNYFGAVYTHVDGNLSCEGEIRLTAVSEDFFPDNGSAIAWALKH